VVTLTGTVTSTAGRERAVALARRTGGVHRVVDRLTVVR
jgi:osmotically-inducible protein OsmY